MDFVFDALSTGKRIKCLTIVDDYTKEAVDIVVDRSISGHYVARALSNITRFAEVRLKPFEPIKVPSSLARH